jgi:hypothetical protein
VSEPIDLTIAALAARQQGNVANWQLVDLGLGRKAVAYRVGRGRLHPAYHGVYGVGRPPTTPLERAAAAVLACGRDAVLSHGSAATLWGFARELRGPFEVTVPARRSRRGITVHRSSTLIRRDRTRHHGIPVTSPARTLLDHAPSLGDIPLARTFNDALLSNYLHRADLAELLHRSPNHPGTRRLWPLVDTSGNSTRSELEDAFAEFCRRFELPWPEIDTRSTGNEVDALFRREQLIVELDGYPFHSDRAAFERDRDRDAEKLAAGIATVRITRRPEREATRLHAILARRRRELTRWQQGGFLHSSQTPLE